MQAFEVGAEGSFLSENICVCYKYVETVLKILMLLFLLSIYQSMPWLLANLQVNHHNHIVSYDIGLFQHTKYNIDSWAWLPSPAAAPPR